MTNKVPLFLFLWCMLSPNKLQPLMCTGSRCVPSHSNSLWFAWTFLMTYPRGKLNSKGLSFDLCKEKSIPIPDWRLNMEPLIKSLMFYLKTTESQHTTIQTQSLQKKTCTTVLTHGMTMKCKHYNPSASLVNERCSLVTSTHAFIGKVLSSNLGPVVRSLDPSFIFKLTNNRLVP